MTQSNSFKLVLINDQSSTPSTEFELFKSEIIKGRSKPIAFRVPVNGLDGVTLIVKDGGDGVDFDHADWVDLKLE